jgi:hypothetical protein
VAYRAYGEEERFIQGCDEGKSDEKNLLGRSKRRWEDNKIGPSMKRTWAASIWLRTGTYRGLL